MAERSIAFALKAKVLKGTVGSNPTSSSTVHWIGLYVSSAANVVSDTEKQQKVVYALLLI